MNMESKPKIVNHLKAMMVGGGVIGLIGAGLGFMAGFTKEGAAGGFFFGWMIGEIFGAAVAESNK